MTDSQNPERITAAAIRWPNGNTTRMAPPNRHHDILRSFGGDDPAIHAAEQGFWTDRERFVTREAAAAIAEAAGQRIRITGPVALLFSEDVW